MLTVLVCKGSIVVLTAAMSSLVSFFLCVWCRLRRLEKRVVYLFEFRRLYHF